MSSKTARATERNAALKNQHSKLADVKPLTHIQQRTARSGLSEKIHLSLKRLRPQGVEWFGEVVVGEVGTSLWRQEVGRRYGMENSQRVNQEGYKIWSVKKKIK